MASSEQLNIMSKKKILVIGDGCIDQYIYGRSDRLCPDAPVPVLIPTKTVENGGMAKNVYSNILSLDQQCDILTNKEEIIKTRYVDEKTNHMFIRVDANEKEIQRVSYSQLQGLKKYDAIVISDYNKGFLTPMDIQYICSNYPVVFMDTKKPLGQWAKKCTYIKINEVEYKNSKNFLKSIDSVFDDNLIVTLGNQGCRYKDKIYPVQSVEVKDMTGAGDTFMAALVVEYLKSNNIPKAIEFANKCATKVVQCKGVVTINDL